MSTEEKPSRSNMVACNMTKLGPRLQYAKPSVSRLPKGSIGNADCAGGVEDSKWARAHEPSKTAVSRIQKLYTNYNEDLE